MLSFWERESSIRYDYIIIGGGIIGLSTAITLKEREPNSSVLVLERGLLPSGASTKNAGFACFGSLTELLADIRTNGEHTTLTIVEQRIRGLAMLRQRLGDQTIGYEQIGGYELLLEKHVDALAELESLNLLLRGIFKTDAFHVKNDKIAAFGFSEAHVRALVYSPFEGQIHTGNMMQALLHYALGKGVMYLTGAEARHIEETNTGAEVSIEHNRLHSTKQVIFEARKIALCTNAFTNRFIHDIDIQPGRGQVFITRPMEGLRFNGIFHVDEGYYYFRRVSSLEGDRILFGGGRNLSPETEATTDFGLSYSIQQYLEEFLRTIIVPDLHAQAKVEKRWTGIMGFSTNKLPIVKKTSERVVLGFGCNGMGIALGSVIGERTAQMLLES